MFQRDYILKLIEQAGDFLRRIAMLRKNNKPDEAREVINQAYQDVLKTNKEKISLLSFQELHSLCSEYEGNSFLLMEFIADLLYEEAQITTNANAKQHLLDKSYHMLLFVNDNDNTFSIDRQRKIEDRKPYQN